MNDVSRVLLDTDIFSEVLEQRDVNVTARAVAYQNAHGRLVVTGPGGIAAEKTPFFASRVYVADTNASRVVTYGSVSRIAE